MVLKKIYLTHFRNFSKHDYSISPYLTLIVGENAHGKTSLLEGVFTTVYGTGFRESREMELITWDQNSSLIEAEIERQGHTFMFQVSIDKSSDTTVTKTYYVNRSKKTSNQYRSMQTQAVLFAPEQIQIITGSPSRRRRYLDEVLSAVDPDYKKSIRQYETALRKRNKVLENYENELQLVAEIAFWDEFLLEHARYITSKRKEYCSFLNDHQSVNGKKFSIIFHADEFTKERLAHVRAREYRLRRTIIGPQKDDYEIILHEPVEKNVSLYGSRSEQRMAIFWLKLNELIFYENKSGIKPILLLDDIFSELDEHNRTLVMKVIKEYQTIATTTEEEISDLSQMPEEVIRL